MIATALATDVIAGLTKPGQKELPSKYLYDTVGSRLFDVITELPEYGLTRAEERILNRHAGDIVKRLPEDLAVAELGSGGGRKTRRILEALCSSHPTAYFPIEISPTALAMCEREVGDIPSISIVGVEHEYLDGLQEVARMRAPRQHLLVLFLGSTIGNFDPPAAIPFLRKIREMLVPGDLLLLGTDLEKPAPLMIAAYNDPLGVTAAFNLNLLARINRELDGTFDLSRFEHAARFNLRTRSIEMHLGSKCAQTVMVGGVEVHFREGETIWTESSHKFNAAEISEMARATGFHPDAQWNDSEWAFADHLWIAASEQSVGLGGAARDCGYDDQAPSRVEIIEDTVFSATSAPSSGPALEALDVSTEWISPRREQSGSHAFSIPCGQPSKGLFRRLGDLKNPGHEEVDLRIRTRHA